MNKMKFAWEHEGWFPRKFVVNYMQENLGWARGATATILKKLKEKEFIREKRGTKEVQYEAVVPKKDYVYYETNEFFKSLHGSSMKSIVSALKHVDDITDEDREALEDFINSRR